MSSKWPTTKVIHNTLCPFGHSAFPRVLLPAPSPAAVAWFVRRSGSLERSGRDGRRPRLGVAVIFESSLRLVFFAGLYALEIQVGL